ncbi:uncharacterized protein LY89DRAFT_789599 [Mollisia scopiformis]|uniref:Uncharacterized protein n=1 Tax=Mollisia scopiformis TaxID=149040 RepID=A0A132B522_MOLSC|nr:uncharacterized protein LY89DRAFT_789599 [Mollisia scopiformis]KUJ07505.1 hypothetical protein LY89DRAFT_789599 [Mollisia scopiformis]
MATSPSPPSANAPPILRLPDEILLKILKYACTSTETIRPELWLPGSSQFGQYYKCITLNTRQTFRFPARVNGRLPEALTAIDLLFTCRAFNNIVDVESLFYRYNNFEFSNTLCILDYLKALPTRRRKAIRNISVMWDFYHPDSGFLALSTCSGLCNLTVDITHLAAFFEIPLNSDIHVAPGYSQLVALRGLKSLTLIYSSGSTSAWENTTWDLVVTVLERVRGLPATDQNKLDMQLEITGIETMITDLVRLPQPADYLPSAAGLAQAFSHSTVVDGDYLLTLPRTLSVPPQASLQPH